MSRIPQYLRCPRWSVDALVVWVALLAVTTACGDGDGNKGAAAPASPFWWPYAESS